MKLAKGLHDSPSKRKQCEAVDGPFPGMLFDCESWALCPFNSDGHHFGGSYVRKGDKFYWQTDAEYARLVALDRKAERERAPARELESKLCEAQLLIDKIEALLIQLKAVVQ